MWSCSTRSAGGDRRRARRSAHAATGCRIEPLRTSQVTTTSAPTLLAVLPGAPVVTETSAAGLIGRSFQATNEAMNRLESAGVVRQATVSRRNRAFEASAIIDAFTALERQLASPTGDTRSAPPRRPAPARPR